MIKRKWRWLSWDCEWTLWCAKPSLMEGWDGEMYFDHEKYGKAYEGNLFDLLNLPRQPKKPTLYKRNGDRWEVTNA